MTKSKKVLGKGLGALIRPEPEDQEEVSVNPTPETQDDGISVEIMAHVSVDRITANPYQPRQEFDTQELRELAQSIKENGLVQPVTVRRWKDGFQLISGERRVRACREAGISHIPAYIRQVETDEEMLELALVENIQRSTLNPVEIALSYQQLVETYGHAPEEIATRVGKDRSTVVNFIRLLKLPKKILDSLQKSEISTGHARALITLPDERAQLHMWQRVVRDGLSVRKTEDLANSIYRRGGTPEPSKKKAKSSSRSSTPYLEELSEKLKPVYGTRVHITAGKDGRGAITLEFYNDEDLERLLDLLLR